MPQLDMVWYFQLVITFFLFISLFFNSIRIDLVEDLMVYSQTKENVEGLIFLKVPFLAYNPLFLYSNSIKQAAQYPQKGLLFFSSSISSQTFDELCD